MTDAHEALGITGDSDADRCRSSEMPSSKATSAASPERPVLNREDAAAQVAAGSGEQRDPCIGNDPACPCQDGDACHYKDTPTTKAWPIPKREQFPGDTLERAIDDYVADYELNDGEVFRAPSDEDRFMLKDAILGLLVDPEWEREWSEHIAMLAQREPLSDSEIEGLWEAASSTTDNDFDIHEFARLIESAHEIGVDEP